MVEDIVIVIANCVGGALVGVVLGCKVRDIMAQRREKIRVQGGVRWPQTMKTISSMR